MSPLLDSEKSVEKKIEHLQPVIVVESKIYLYIYIYRYN